MFAQHPFSIYIKICFSRILGYNQCPIPFSSQCCDPSCQINLNLSLFPSFSPFFPLSHSVFLIIFWFQRFPKFHSSLILHVTLYLFEIFLFAYASKTVLLLAIKLKEERVFSTSLAIRSQANINSQL